MVLAVILVMTAAKARVLRDGDTPRTPMPIADTSTRKFITYKMMDSTFPICCQSMNALKILLSTHQTIGLREPSSHTASDIHQYAGEEKSSEYNSRHAAWAHRKVH